MKKTIILYMIIDTLFKNLCLNISPSSPPWYPACTSEKCTFYSFLLLFMMTMGALENLCKNDLGLFLHLVINL